MGLMYCIGKVIAQLVEDFLDLGIILVRYMLPNEPLESDRLRLALSCQNTPSAGRESEGGEGPGPAVVWRLLQQRGLMGRRTRGPRSFFYRRAYHLRPAGCWHPCRLMSIAMWRWLLSLTGAVQYRPLPPKDQVWQQEPSELRHGTI